MLYSWLFWSKKLVYVADDLIFSDPTSVWTVSQANKSVTGSKTRVTCHKFLCDMSQKFFPAARQTSGPAAESAPFGGLTRNGALALARCARL